VIITSTPDVLANKIAQSAATPILVNITT
jgi:hypothetical protein